MGRKSWLGMLAMLSLAASSVQGAPGQFGRTLIRGVAVEAPPQMLYSNGDILSGESICAGIDQLRPAIHAVVGQLVTEINARIKQKVDGVQLVRTNFVVSPNCQARTEVVGANSGLLISLSMPGNYFVTNVTQGVLGQYADPRMSFTFDADVAVHIPLPQAGGSCLGAPNASARIRNITLPEGHNISGEIVAAGIDIGTSIYDHFNNGRLGKMLATGVRWQEAVPAGFIDDVNRQLCRSGVPYRTIAITTAPDDLLLMRLSTGAKIEDARCMTGYVWREAKKDDLVCVTPEIRAQVREENRLHRDRVVPLSVQEMKIQSFCIEPGACRSASSGPRACLAGFVWREAVANDFTCVPPSSRAQAQDDNRQARRRRLDYEPVIN